MSSPVNLSPPKRTHTEDPGAHELDSDSDEHFSDAQSIMSPTPASPIPRTRVEKVSDEPSYGEVPGTDAYRKREGDAAPDEIAIIPDDTKKDGTPGEAEGESAGEEKDAGSSRPASPLPGGQPIPVTVVEQAAGESGPYSETFVKMRQADAPPDVVVKSAEEEGSKDDSGRDDPQEQDGPEQAPSVPPASVSSFTAPSPQFLTSAFSTPGAFPSTNSELADDDASEFHTGNNVSREGSLHDDADDAKDTDAKADSPTHEDDPVNEDRPEPEASHDEEIDDAEHSPEPELVDDKAGDDDFGDDFGDDFDDFEEGAEDADFDDFGDDGFQEPELTPVQPPPREPTPRPQPSQLPYSIPDFDGLESDEISSILDPYLALLFPPEQLAVPELPPSSKKDPIFLTPRSASLWSQLVAPPPLAPPDWIRSRIRRAFLVSLGVPVDLDEILPASKQKKLILPSIAAANANSRGGTPRTSSELRSVARLKSGDANASSVSVDSQGNPKKSSSPSKTRRGQASEPEFDLVSARQLCMTTSEALDGMTDEELKEHIVKLEAMQLKANEALEYWKKRADEKIGDREAFEGVIENLVKHARKVRK